MDTEVLTGFKWGIDTRSAEAQRRLREDEMRPLTGELAVTVFIYAARRCEVAAIFTNCAGRDRDGGQADRHVLLEMFAA